MDMTKSDSTDGKNPDRQFTIIMTYLLSFMLTWLVLEWFQKLIFGLAHMSAFSKAYFQGGYYIPITLFIWGIFWISVFSNGKGWQIVKGNFAKATINPFDSKILSTGGTKFIVYQTGFSLSYPWETSHGKEIELDKEVTTACDLTTITVKNISLHVILVITYRIFPEGLSTYLQNLVVGESEPQVLKQIKASANQRLEVEAAKLKNTEEVRKEQSKLIEKILPELDTEAKKLGIEITAIKFSKCDYSQETEKELNKSIEATVVAEIAKSIKPENVEAYKIAAAATGKPGFDIKSTTFEIKADPEIVALLKGLDPGVLSAFIVSKTVEGK